MGELEIEYKEEKAKELSFKTRKTKPVPLSICPYCHGLGYFETGEDTQECRPCKGTGRNKE
jgi:DnaJ-class molecular chaperone